MANRNQPSWNPTTEQPTNFCTYIECLTPLTPDEIHPHYELHATNGTPAHIQSIRNTKTICAKKLTSTIHELTKGIEDHDIQYILNPEELYNSEVRKMDQCRETMIEMINIFFETQKKKLKSSIEMNLLKVKDIGSVFGEIKEVISQLEGLRNNLENTNPFPSISKTCRLDVKSMVDRYRSQIKKVMTTRDLDPITVHIDDHNLFQLSRHLSKIVHVITHQENDEAQSSAKKETSQVMEHHSEIPDLMDNRESLSRQSNHSRLPNDSQPRLHQFNIPSNPTSPPINHQPKPSTRVPPPNNPPPQQPPQPAPISNQQMANLFKVQQPDYFEKTAHKFLHFFKNEDTLLYMLEITQLPALPKFSLIRLNQNFTVPYFHRSIATPKGDIFVSGGTLADESKCEMIYFYDPTTQSLQGQHLQLSISLGIAAMTTPRSSHSMVYCQGQIFLISGFAHERQLTTSVERLNTTTMSISRMADCLQPANSPTCCSFANKYSYIYKFGGNMPDGSLVQLIERYDINRNMWEHLDPKLDQHEIDNFDQYRLIQQQKRIYQYAACCQINQTSILIFGGYDQDNQGSAFSFLLSLDDHQETSILGTNIKPLPCPEGFWNNQGSRMYVLQNIDVEGEIDETRRKILCFDGVKWFDYGEGE